LPPFATFSKRFCSLTYQSHIFKVKENVNIYRNISCEKPMRLCTIVAIICGSAARLLHVMSFPPILSECLWTAERQLSASQATDWLRALMTRYDAFSLPTDPQINTTIIHSLIGFPALIFRFIFAFSFTLKICIWYVRLQNHLLNVAMGGKGW